MKKIIAIFLVLTLFASSVFAQLPDEEKVDKEKVKVGLTEFVTGLADTVPAVSTMNNVWADAYVGQLIGVPPHLGTGFSAGLAKMDISCVKKAASALGIDSISKLNDNFVLPTISMDFALGGLFLPFDLTGSFWVMKEPVSLGGLQYSTKSFNVKLRVPILKQNLVLPNLSLGVGYAKNSGEFSVSADKNLYINTTYSSEIYSADLQVSKSVIFLTPYAGARVLASKSDNSWKYIDPITGGDKGTYKNEDMNINYQLFAGTSFNFLVVRLNVNAAIDLKSKLWSAGLGVQVKL